MTDLPADALGPATADLCDRLGEAARVLTPRLRHFGGRRSFAGTISTLEVHEDNSLLRAALAEPGAGRVLVVDGGGSMRCALLGDRLGELAVANGWSGVVIHGCVRDSEALARLPLGVMALATHPRRSVKRGEGRRDVPIDLAGVAVAPGERLHADADGAVVTASAADT